MCLGGVGKASAIWSPGGVFLADGREMKIVTSIDHSTYCVIAKTVVRATARPCCQALLDAMTTYGNY